MRILAIDQGTSGTKALVVEPDGSITGLAEVSVRPEYLADGGVEQSPDGLLESVLEAGSRALGQAGGAVDGVALANQGETVLAWDRGSGQPLTPAIVWQDSRSQGICNRLAPRADEIAARTGLVLDPYFSAPKMAWIRERLTRDGVVTTSDAWLVHRLTGEFVTDVTTASRSLILDIDAREWSAGLLQDFGLGSEELPRLAACDEVVGTTNAFGGSLPVAGLIVDQQAALFAEGCLEPGEMKCTYGTGAFVLAHCGSGAARSTYGTGAFVLAHCGSGAARSQHGLTTSVAWAVKGAADYCIDGQVFTAASAVRWMTDLGLLESSARLDDEASHATGDDVLFVPALAGLGAPWWRSDATASFAGLSLATSAADLVRAVLLGVAAQVAGLVEAMAQDAGKPAAVLKVDGGLTNSVVLMQAQADLLQVPVAVYPSAHATALGAAAMGRLALDARLRPQDALVAWTPSRVYEPQWSADRAGDYRDRWQAHAEATMEEGVENAGR